MRIDSEAKYYGVIDRSKMDAMNFLNEVGMNYPEAISFASGRPLDEAFQVDDWLEKVRVFVSHKTDTLNCSEKEVYNMIAQYGSTSGMIQDIVSKQIENDEGIKAEDNDIILTAGCQEALLLCLKALFKQDDEVLIVCDPTYTGIIGLSIINNIPVQSISSFCKSNFIESLMFSIDSLLSKGKTPRALYLIPDFDNPTGETLSLESRESLLNICQEKGVFIIEDNPYGMFRFEGKRISTLYEMDNRGSVFYAGTYSKTLCPSIRVGFIVLPSGVLQSQNKDDLRSEISTLKSYTTVNTSQIMQAMVGGILLEQKHTLKKLNSSSTIRYRSNRDSIILAFKEFFSDYRGVHWNYPIGGFFINLELPFSFSAEDATFCAKTYRVICMPLSFFSLSGACDNIVRFSFSNLSTNDIFEGVKRFSDYVNGRIGE